MSQTAPTSEPFLKSVDRYWFDQGSPVTLGIYRILLGTLAFINLVMIGASWESWYGEKGFIPAWLGQLWLRPTVMLSDSGPAVPRIGLLNGITDPHITQPFFLLVTLAAITTALGLWTRVSSLILAIGLVSLDHRNAAILHGGDTMLRVMSLYIAISPSGSACSLDRLIAIWKGRATAVPTPISLWPQRLISYNVALLYFTTVWLKWGGTLWKDGTATWYPARLAEFYRFPVPPIVNEMPMVKVSTYGTLLVEFALATFVFFRPLRGYVVFLGVLMHMYIEYSMNIPLFSYLMITSYVCFYEGEEFVALGKRLGARLKRKRVTALYPAGTSLTPAASEFFRAADPLELVTYEPGNEPAWQATNANGKTVAPGWSTWSRSVGAWGFAWIPGLWRRVLERATHPVESTKKS